MKKQIILVLIISILFSCNKEKDVYVIQDANTLDVKHPNPHRPPPVVVVPRANHVVICIMENHAYQQIIGNTSAPYINALAKDAYSVNFLNSYAIEHPSQPNYLDLYSGKNQGIIDDNVPVGTTTTTGAFTSLNLGRQLIDSGMSFKSYCETLPSVGYEGATATGNYVRKHNPVANWQGTGVNQVSSAANQPFTSFPIDFTTLPTVCYVVPNQYNDMHDGTIAQGDTWIQNNMNAYIQWAKTNNSLFILTWDEDDRSHSNQITTIFTGPMVLAGSNSTKITHYNVLRTIEDMYKLPAIANAITSTSIPCWK